MSINSFSSSSIVSHTINNSSICMYTDKHYEFIFVAFTTLVNIHTLTKSLPQIHQISQSCENCAFYTNFVNCSGNFYLLCSMLLICLPTTFKTMLA